MQDESLHKDNLKYHTHPIGSVFSFLSNGLPNPSMHLITNY